ncbi:mechanosensitive ion channel domain-containing protein [Desulfosarcina sp.]|uniref:mechanosensitive ion channel family protein n=1 Tax=Desulfosarcina sp. TaxID=2027861 RepID=UPI0039708851
MKWISVAPIRGFLAAIPMALFFLSTVIPVTGEETPLPLKSAGPPPAVPSLADVVYQAGALGQRLEVLKTRIDAVDGLRRMEQRLEGAKTQTDRLHTRLGAINADDLQSYQQLAALKGEVRGEADAVKRVTASLTEIIQEVESRRRIWLTEKDRWDGWRSQLGADLSLKSVADAFTRANTDINQALGIITRNLEPLLAVQQKAGEVGARISGLSNQIDAVMVQQRGGTIRGGTIFSAGYLRQLIDLTQEPGKMINILPLPDAFFFSQKGWVVGLQTVVFALLFALLRRYRPLLLGHADRRFLGKRQVAAAMFVSIFTLSFLYGPQPTLWRMLIETLAGVATARLVAAFVRDAWIKRAIYILTVMMVGFQALLALGVPLVLMRLFILVWTVVGLIYFGWRARIGALSGKSAVIVWLLRLVVLVFAVIAAADIIGLSGFAVQLMDGAIRTAVLLLMGWAMIRLIRVAIEMAVESLPMERLPFLGPTTHSILPRFMGAVNVLIVVFVAANLLVAWKVYSLPAEVLQDFFTFGLTIGGQKITVGLVLVAAVILYATFVLSWSLQGLLMENVLSNRQMDTGARLSIVRLVHYGLVLVGFLIALSALGFELKNVTIIGGALGVGIGFGMQAIVNNFVSGLILLFERPIKVGDVIQLSDGQQGWVMNLGLRATTIQTFDRAEIVVPNGDLISSPVTNWTLGDRSMRITIPVGVAYGSDVEMVMRVLMAVATESDHVLKDPQPVVLFLNFGDSSLDFELRVWIADVNNRLIVQSALIREIDRRFRAEGVEIPFPQRDLHLRSVDGKAADHLRGGPRPPAGPLSPVKAAVTESE